MSYARKFIYIVSLILLIGIMIFVGDIITLVLHPRIPPYGSIVLKDSRGSILTEKGRSGGYMLPYAGNIDTDIIRDIITIEDRRFSSHHGIDLWGKIASIVENIQAGGIVRGGSTITEQYIKNTYYPGKSRTFAQKIREGIAAIIIEAYISKEEILRGYLDSIYFGNNIYGLETVLRTYYGGKNLTDDDILDIITRINSPNIREDRRESIIEYRDKVKKRLGKGDGETQLFEGVNQHKIELYPLVTEKILRLVREYCTGDTEGLKKWTTSIKENPCTSPHIHLTLTLDGELMNYARLALETTLSPLAEKNVGNGAIYIYDPSHSTVLAYIANRQGGEYDHTAIDMITRRRSVGSILKPFIYLLALEKGYDINDYILDDTKIYPTGYIEKGFVPVNYVEKSYGPVRLREALGNSLNSSTVRLSEQLGIGEIYDFFRKNNLALNHDSGYYGYGIALGGVELTLENIVESFTHLTDLGDPQKYLLYETLRDNTNRAKTFGISSILNTSLPLAVKTGTSTDFRDNWTLSYHPHAIIGVWVGNSNASSMEDVSGVSGAGPLWHMIAEYMISRGLITDIELSPPEPLKDTTFCLDISCSQKEIRLSQKQEEQKSRPKSNLYYSSDFVSRMTDEEEKRWKIRR